MSDARRKAKEKKKETNKKLDTTAKTTRTMAVERIVSRVTDIDDWSDTPQRKVRKVIASDSEDKELGLLKRSIEERRQTTWCRIKINQQRLDRTSSVAVERYQVAECKQQLYAKHLKLQQGLLDIVRQKAMSQLVTKMLNMQKREGFVSLLTGLVQKLV